MYSVFTRDELGIIRQLVRREAAALGYGEEYTYANKQEWPRRLKKLKTIWNKLTAQIEDYDKIYKPWTY